jgi:hypothetical protein
MTTFRKNRNSRDHQRGVALIAALIALLLVAAITAGMIILSNTETNISGNFRDEQTAYFASRGGLSEVRDRMMKAATDSVYANIPTALPGTSGGIMYIINPLAGETVAPWNTAGNNYPDDEICKELSCSGGVPSGGTWYTNPSGATGKGSTTYASNPQLAWKWVRVMSKVNRSDLTTRVVSVDGASTVGQPTLGQRVCWDEINNHEVVTTLATCLAANANWHPVYELTSLAVTSSGARRISQYELAAVQLPALPGSMIFDGPGADFHINPNSNALTVNGTDIAQGPNAGVGCGAPTNEPAIGTYSPGDNTTVTGQLNRPSAYTGGPPNAAVANVNSQLSIYSTVDGLTLLTNAVIAAAGSNVYTSPAGPVNWGTPSQPIINVVNGDYSGPISGSGILLVTGIMTSSGNPSFNGLVLVIGKGELIKNGGGNGVINGSLFVANMYTNTSYTNLIPLGSNLPPGPPIIQWNGGGNATINYDSCWINALGQSLPLRLVTSRELIY